MNTADEVLEWARGVEPATFEETVNAGLETRRAKWERSLADDRATAKRIAKAMRLLDAYESDPNDELDFGDWLGRLGIAVDDCSGKNTRDDCRREPP